MVDSTLFSLATLNAHPAMNPDSVIQGDHWRIGSSRTRSSVSNGPTAAVSWMTPRRWRWSVISAKS